jgi:uncharacterized membrane protein
VATLLAITYPESDRARQAMEWFEWSDFDRATDIKAACWITIEDGEPRVHPLGHPVARKATLGGALGLLVGGPFAIPVVGIAAGALIGIHEGRQKEIGIDDAFVASIGAQLESGGSAAFVLLEEEADTAKAASDLARYGGTVHSADLPPEGLARFQAMLDQANQDATPSGSNATTG